MQFSLRNIDDLRKALAPLPVSGDLSILKRSVAGANFLLPNPLVNQPMEGCDADPDGSPTELSFRRYARFAAGGTGLIWAEAIAVVPEGRGNPRHLWIHPENLESFRKLVQTVHRAAEEAGNPRPLFIAQLTHAGRNSTLGRVPATQHSVMDPHQGLEPGHPVISDEELLKLQDAYVNAAKLCREAGFDGVDVKCCHLYLFSELLGAYGREGAFGGTRDRRFRMTLETLEKVKKACGDDYVYASRMNGADCMTGGFDTDAELEPKYEESLLLARELTERGVTILNVTLGTPYYNPHINRPYASFPKGEGYPQPEPPIRGVKRLLTACSMVQQSCPDTVCVATGFSYLQHLAPYAAAGMAQAGLARAFGFGRQSFAYPDFARDILEKGAMEKSRSCVTCGLCTYLMRNGKHAGCPVRDAAQYRPYLDEIRREKA